MKPELMLLALRRARELGNEFFRLHQELMKWRPEPLPDVEKMKLTIRIQEAVAEQYKWLAALETALEEDDLA